jgi:hypothetical protein
MSQAPNASCERRAIGSCSLTLLPLGRNPSWLSDPIAAADQLDAGDDGRRDRTQTGQQHCKLFIGLMFRMISRLFVFTHRA